MRVSRTEIPNVRLREAQRKSKNQTGAAGDDFDSDTLQKDLCINRCDSFDAVPESQLSPDGSSEILAFFFFNGLRWAAAQTCLGTLSPDPFFAPRRF